MTKEENAQFWANRYAEERTGWDIGYPSPPLTNYLDGLTDKGLKILIPGAGNGYEAEYAWKQGFKNVSVLDIAAAPLANLQQRILDFPNDQLLEGDFFAHTGQYDLILEQTFFCSFEPKPATRQAYARQMHSLLQTGGKLVGLWFDLPTGTSRPFGGSREEYLSYLEPYFNVLAFAKTPDSIKPRAGNEFFGEFQKEA